MKNHKNKLLDQEGSISESWSVMEVEIMERTIALEGKRHQMKNQIAQDKLLIVFSRILVIAAIITLAMIILSSFEIPYVNVNPEFVKLLIGAVIVEIAGITSTTLLKSKGLKDEKEE